MRWSVTRSRGTGQKHRTAHHKDKRKSMRKGQSAKGSGVCGVAPAPDPTSVAWACVWPGLGGLQELHSLHDSGFIPASELCVSCNRGPVCISLCTLYVL